MLCKTRAHIASLSWGEGCATTYILIYWEFCKSRPHAKAKVCVLVCKLTYKASPLWQLVVVAASSLGWVCGRFIWFGHMSGRCRGRQISATNQSDKSVRQNWVQDRFDCKKQGILNKVGGVVATKAAARADGPENNYVVRLLNFCRLGQKFLSLGCAEFCRRGSEILSIIFVDGGLYFCRWIFAFLSVCVCV